MKLLLLITLSLTAAGSLAQPIPATTDDGREVLLLDDGTWRFVAETPTEATEATDRPASATQLYRGARIGYGIWLDPSKWTSTSTAQNEDAEFAFEHTDGDVYAVVIAERIYFPYETMKDIAITNAKQVMSDLHVTDEESLTVNGAGVFRLEMEGLFQGAVPIVYFGQYHVSEEVGTIQVVTFTASNLVDEYGDDLRDLMNGFVILEDEESH